MKKILISLIFISSFLVSQEVEEVVVVSSLTSDDRQLSEIGDPIHVVSGEDLEDSGTQSLGESFDELLGVSSVDYGAVVGQPAIRGLLDGRVKILRNGLSVADVAGMGADHLNEVDLNNVTQVEIIRGPSSLLYAKGSIGGVINVIDNTIAKTDFEEQVGSLGFEKQSVNWGNAENFAYQKNVAGVNLSLAYKDSQFGNYAIPNGAIAHSEDEHEEEVVQAESEDDTSLIDEITPQVASEEEIAGEDYSSIIDLISDSKDNNEKMEFLGDRVLGLIISKNLLKFFL